MNRTDIEYLDYTWNPFAMRCTPISEGCANCWHIRRADMLKNNPKLSMEVREAYAGDREPVLVKSRLEDPVKLKRPSIIGVQFMGDLFHKDVSFDWLPKIFNMVFRTPHTFLYLTKHPERMAEWIDRWKDFYGGLLASNMPRIWLGVTCENQAAADERIPILLQIPAAVRFVSLEPLLDAIHLKPYFNYPENVYYERGLDWVIAGCESGPGRRPSVVDWFRSLRDQCQEAMVPFFLKQMEVDGKVVHMPELDGKVWDEMPRGGDHRMGFDEVDEGGNTIRREGATALDET